MLLSQVSTAASSLSQAQGLPTALSTPSRTQEEEAATQASTTMDPSLEAALATTGIETAKGILCASEWPL